MVKKTVLLMLYFLLLFSTLGLAQNSIENDVAKIIAPNAIKLDIDEFKLITHEVVVIEKERKEALIDLKGNFIIPWGKYTYGRNMPQTWGDLICVQDPLSDNIGYIDFSGKVVIPLSHELIYSSGFNHFGLSNVHGILPNSSYVIDKKGTKYPHNSVETDYGDDYFYRENYKTKQYTNRILIAQSEPSKGYTSTFSIKGSINKERFSSQIKKVGYGNKSGKIIVPADYAIIREFTNQRAAVMKRDEFGVAKWGFIDTLGKVVIPFTFKVEPGYFHDGLALVEPTDKTDFQFAYIDQSGEIKIKLPGRKVNDGTFTPLSASMLSSNITEGGYFINGLSFWNRSGKRIILDTSGKFLTIEELVYRSDDTNKEALSMIDYDEIGIYYEPVKGLFTSERKGLVDFRGNKIYSTNFTKICPDYYSSYAIARFGFGHEKIPKYGLWLDGVIDKDGKFIMIKEKGEIF